MSRLGFEQSNLSKAMERATKVTGLLERAEHAAPATLVDVCLVTQQNGQDLITTAYVNRAKLVAFLTEEQKAAVELAHRLMHGVTGD